jgi:CheY-like chemotaxis protein
MQRPGMVPVQILLVEDDPLICLVATEMLDGAGFVVDEASNATEAMAKLIAVTPRFDAVIVDIGLPDRPGDALAREMRLIHPDLPIVIASGYDPHAIAARFKDDSHIAFVGKPYDSEALVSALRALGVTAEPRNE